MERITIALLVIIIISVQSFGLYFYIKLDKIEKDIEDFLNQ
jgi:hypothetical protein